MKFAYKDMGHVLTFEPGYVNELVVENKNMFFGMANSITVQTEGQHGNAVLSLKDKPVELSRYADVTVQFAPFQINRKSLLTKLCTSLEQKAVSEEHYKSTIEILNGIDRFVQIITEEYPFEIECPKTSIGAILRAVSPMVAEDEINALEKIIDYMELVRTLDKERLFIMINMRTYFTDTDMEEFIKCAVSRDLKILLLESSSHKKLANTRRYVIDSDLCEF